MVIITELIILYKKDVTDAIKKNGCHFMNPEQNSYSTIDVYPSKYTILIVTHNMQQASRVSDHTAFFYLGEMVEYGATKDVFTNPVEVRTQNYITGRFG